MLFIFGYCLFLLSVLINFLFLLLPTLLYVLCQRDNTDCQEIEGEEEEEEEEKDEKEIRTKANSLKLH